MEPAGVGGLDVCEVSTRLRGGPTRRRLGTPYAVGVLWMRGLPSYGCPHEVEGGLGLGLFCWGFAYCLKCGGWTFLGGPGEGSLCGHVVEGFLALFCGGSLGGPSATFCGCASWLAWWWISGASMGIPSSLLSISGLGPGVMRRIALHLDASSGFVGSVRPMFDGVGAGRRPGVFRLG
jgi:hypothetical protein